MIMQQRTLTGDEAESGRERPDTMRTCLHCDEMVLRSQWGEHREHDREWREAHSWPDDGPWDPDSGLHEETEDDEDDEDGDDEPREVGAVYDITLSYSVDYRLRVTAWDEHQAEEQAKMEMTDAVPSDRMHVHTDKRKVKTVYEDDPEAEDIEGDW